MQGVTGKEVIAKLKAAGWSLDRIYGSHHILTKDGGRYRSLFMAPAISAPVLSPRSSANLESS